MPTLKFKFRVFLYSRFFVTSGLPFWCPQTGKKKKNRWVPANHEIENRGNDKYIHTGFFFSLKIRPLLLTIFSVKTSVEPRVVNMLAVIARSAMKEAHFIASLCFIHLFLSDGIYCVKSWVLNSLNLYDIIFRACLSELAFNSLIFLCIIGWIKLTEMNSFLKTALILWLWSPMFWKKITLLNK